MNTQYEKLYKWLNRLTDTEFQDTINMFLTTEEQNALDPPKDRGSVLRDIETWNKLFKLKNHLLEKYPDRFLDEKPNTSELPAHPISDPLLPSQIHLFINQKSTITNITNAFVAQYHLVDAPAGYGKTYLLCELERRLTKQKWKCAYVSAEHFDDEAGLTTMLSQALGFEEPLKIKDFKNFGHSLKQKFKTPIDAKGVIIFIDLQKYYKPEVIGKLIETFIDRMYFSLRSHEFFGDSNNPNRFRLVVAGRYLANRPEFQKFYHHPLSLFEYNDLLNSVREYFKNINKVEEKTISAHIMHLSGGHPKSMDRLLKLYKSDTLYPNDFIVEYNDEINHIMSETINEVKSAISGLLKDTMITLSPCRRFNYKFVEQFVKFNLITLEKNIDYLLDELRNNFLITRRDGFLQDDITARLLAIGLQQDNPTKFIEISQKAKEVYLTLLRRLKTNRPAIIFVELLYQNLQLGYYHKSKENQLKESNLKQREILKNHFFSELNDYLSILIKNRDRREVITDLKEVLAKDYGFQFTLNYFLRKEDYNEDPYQEDLIKHIEQFYNSQ